MLILFYTVCYVHEFLSLLNCSVVVRSIHIAECKTVKHIILGKDSICTIENKDTEGKLTLEMKVEGWKVAVEYESFHDRKVNLHLSLTTTSLFPNL